MQAGSITLTDNQKELLEYWESYTKEHGEEPSLNKAKKHFNRSSINSIQQIVDSLLTKGLMEKKQVPGRMGNVYSVVEPGDRINGEQENLEGKTNRAA